jgi:hypothetical protein
MRGPEWWIFGILFTRSKSAFSFPPSPNRPQVGGGQQAIQTNNVEIDHRGYIYLVDRANSGLHIVRLTGAAAKIVTP